MDKKISGNISLSELLKDILILHSLLYTDEEDFIKCCQ